MDRGPSTEDCGPNYCTMAEPIREILGLEILDMDIHGRGWAKYNGRTVLVENALPGEVVDVNVYRKDKGMLLARPTNFIKTSPERVEPTCKHFGVCGGCKWQNVEYTSQLQYKTAFVAKAFKQLEHLDLPTMRPIVPSDNLLHYRNKMDYGFTSRRWLTAAEMADGPVTEGLTGLGQHPSGAFDKILHLDECFLLEEPGNTLRLAVKQFADEQGITFHDHRARAGYLRQLILRNSSLGEWMIILMVGETDPTDAQKILDFIEANFPQAKSFFYVINDTLNDSIFGKELVHYKGQTYINEKLGEVMFRIGPLSFFQTNHAQAVKLYNVAAEMANLKPHETVYDLYTGTGSIALYIANQVKHVTGIELIPEAIADAWDNARRNNITNVHFIAADMKDVIKKDYFKNLPKPDLLITDPPRAGMHPKVVEALLEAEIPRIVYVSCNPVTQATDLLGLSKKYRITAIQPVDMFPQTYHVENVVALELI